MSLHVVVGSGPLGRHTAQKLSEMGEHVRIVSRNPPESSDGVETWSADATVIDELKPAVDGAAVVYNCANAPYHRWARDLPPIWNGIQAAAAAAGARLVIGTNLYAFGLPNSPFTAESPLDPCSRKGRVRARLESKALDAHNRGELKTALIRASDFYGPDVTESSLGDRFFLPTLDGKPSSLIGRLDVPHSYTYLPDFAAAMAVVGTREDTWGRTWIAPSVDPATGLELETLLRRCLDDVDSSVSVRTMGKGMLRLAGLFVPAARELIEMYYEFDRAFAVDSSFTEEALQIPSTPLDRGFKETIQWYRFAGLKGAQTADVR